MTIRLAVNGRASISFGPSSPMPPETSRLSAISLERNLARRRNHVRREMDYGWLARQRRLNAAAVAPAPVSNRALLDPQPASRPPVRSRYSEARVASGRVCRPSIHSGHRRRYKSDPPLP